VIFSDTEIKELFKAWAAITIAFSIASGGLAFHLQFLALSGLTVGIGFLFHEMGHKFVAQRMGFPAEFRAFDTMLVVAILMSFTGFVFAAPGAVFITALPTTKENGKISTAGPGASLLLATFFLIPSLLFNTNSKAALILEQGFAINAWWAFFNLLPFPNFDGPKIFRWNKVVYGLMAATAFSFSFLL
jgi:Zn-dependent protease